MINRVIVHRDGGKEVVRIRQHGGDPWEVRTPTDSDWWDFAAPTASKRTVKQLVRKKWCDRYTTDPDDFSDRS